MDAIGAASAIKQNEIHTAIAYQVAAKSLDAQRQQGDAVNALLEQAVQLSKSLGSGENLDTQA